MMRLRIAVTSSDDSVRSDAPTVSRYETLLRSSGRGGPVYTPHEFNLHQIVTSRGGQAFLDLACRFAQFGDHRQVESAGWEAAQRLITFFALVEPLEQRQIEIEDRCPAFYPQRWVQLEEASGILSSPHNRGGALGMLVGPRRGRLHFTRWHQAFGQPLQLEQRRAAVAFARVHSRGKMRDFFRQLAIARVNLAADLEQTEGSQTAGCFRQYSFVFRASRLRRSSV